MGPSKRKGSVRRQVLDLNAREDSPSRPTWQNKYQNTLPEKDADQNGDSLSSTVPTQNNPLSGLLGNYNSDSDSEESNQKPNSSLDAKVEDFLKEIQSISTESTIKQEGESNVIQTDSQEKMQMSYPSSVTAWQQCYDHNSGYPYYWNTETNEVTWEMPLDLKAAITNVALKQQQQQQQDEKTQSEVEVKKKICKYPWQTESDSEDEKVEMITSFGPQSGEESDQEEQNKTKKNITSHLPTNTSKINSCLTLAPEDPEGLIENTYETSSLLTHGVQDTGPPGDETFELHKKPTTKVPVLTSKEESKTQISIETTINLEKQENTTETINETKTLQESIVDDVIAQIEKETPPDYDEKTKPDKNNLQTSPVNQTSGIALIANYGDDSEPEDNSFTEKQEKSTKTSIKPLFPIEIPQEKVKPLFPCMGAEPSKLQTETRVKETPSEESEPISNIYNTEIEDPAAQKAFKRKKRIEFATIVYGPSTSKVSESKTESVECLVSVPTTQYNMDPNSNEHHGFGFKALKTQVDSERKSYKLYGGIQFIKAETINLSETKVKEEAETETASGVKGGLNEAGKDEEIEDAATLLREKVTFLTGGTESISPIQQMAIELETLVLAWQQGALTPSYLLRWLKEKCSELLRHEKTAAPAGWTCLWDRKSKRYYYRNATTKAIQWEYPNVEEKIKGGKDGDVEGAGDEMDICDTPPHTSPPEPEKNEDKTPSTPPPPVISDASDNVLPSSPTPQPPPPPQISFCPENESSSAKVVKKRKRKAEEMSSSVKDEAKPVSPPSPNSKYEDSSSESVEPPPLPPLPPPPPPPPDESPPPLPDSPPPLPLDPDQPLPPGVDEPEYSLFRTSKHSYKKTQPDSTSYSAELMMTYGYGLPVQQVVSSNGQTMTMPMRPIEYHTYMHEPVTNPYLVQSAQTSHVIHYPAKKSKPSLTSELVSFYSDLAMLDNAGETGQNVPPTTSQEPVPPPPTPTPASTPIRSPTPTPLPSKTETSKASGSVTSNGVSGKKKKKTKTSSGLSLKKKGVSSLVAKWQQVQQEVRRDFSDDDDDTSSAK